MDTVCNICDSNLVQEINVREQMLGLNGWFIYLKCIACGHAHLYNIPENMDKFYDPNEYYSFKKKRPFFKSASYKAFSLLGNVDWHSDILDYGCGGGAFVRELHAHGYKNAKGFDPYLPDKLCTVDLTKNVNNTLYHKWDVITLNHVFEHLTNPIERLQELNMMLSPTGKLILRFPVIDSLAYEIYKEDWVQFDAPRHFNLFTRESIRIAVEKAGNYKILDMYDDSDHFGFTGSDFYVVGKSLKENTFIKRLFSFKSYRYALLAKKLNKENRGDRIVIILQKT